MFTFYGDFDCNFLERFESSLVNYGISSVRDNDVAKVDSVWARTPSWGIIANVLWNSQR